ACPGKFDIKVVSSEGKVGGGSYPTSSLPSPSVRVVPVGSSPDKLEKHLRTAGDPPILAVVQDDAVLIHMRTLFDDDAGVIIDRLKNFTGGKR
ncbi:MAG TPA: L-seryl-tRNA(Sec) selenium transferase, partial [Acidobacteriota bacterium]|nr:L-seryl-tRNA(Sec) selenium transferase [Acidobacteriota bacterium]HQO20901.1 L-seryl-tRNA(Sec) selenium transferase [Acidobacteriota bacterium]